MIQNLKGGMNMSIKVVMDLDGTVYDLYGKSDWLETLRAERTGAFTAYGENNGFLPEINVKKFYEIVNTLLEMGVQFCVTTWLPMQASPEYEEVCRAEKLEWVKQYMPFVTEFNCVSYGIPKQNCIQKRASRMYLIDDNAEVRETWQTAKQRISVGIDKNFTVVDSLVKIYNEIKGE